MAGLQTEFDFVLPKGYVDGDGNLHRKGTMRLATARDEMEPLRDPRVQDANDPYLTIIVLSRVVTELGTLSQVTPREIEGLFAADLAFLQDVYGIINFGTPDELEALQRSMVASAAPAAPATSAAPAAAVMPGPAAAVAGAAEPEGDEMYDDEPRPRSRRSLVEEVKSSNAG